MTSRDALLFACALVLLPAAAPAQKMYKHTDAQGNVVYSDRPNTAGQSPEKRKPANAASPEATRQMEIERQELLRTRRAEELAARRRAATSPPPGGRVATQERIVVRDPNLPPTPPADSERRYYYNGR